MLCIENQVSFRKCISWTHSNYLTIFVFLFLFCVKCTPRIHFFAKLKLRTKRTADSSWCQQSFFCGLLRSGNVSDTVRVYLVFKRQTSNLYCIKRSAHDRISRARRKESWREGEGRSFQSVQRVSGRGGTCHASAPFMCNSVQNPISQAE